MSDVFFNYAKDNRERARVLVRALAPRKQWRR